MSVINEKSNFTFEFQPVTKLFEEQVRLHPEARIKIRSTSGRTQIKTSLTALRATRSGILLHRLMTLY